MGVGIHDQAGPCVSEVSAEQRLIRLELRLEEELDSIKNQISDLQQDSLLWATLYLRDVAAEALLFACGDQPDSRGPSYRFRDLANNDDSKLAAYAATLPLTPDPTKLGTILDGIMTRRSSTVHLTAVQGLQEAVTNVEGLLARHPDLRRRCQHEVIVIDSLAELQDAFCPSALRSQLRSTPCHSS